ncbi:MAG TPA: tetratricopeptide repeat protein [Stellaceae bacterium]|nr:tetratricopeptide repeat protein [Stellaceae bacterium]
MGTGIFRPAAAVSGLILSLGTALGAMPPLAGDAALARLAQAEALHGKSSPELLPIIGELAASQMQSGALAKAAHLRRRALDIVVAAYGSGSVRAAAAMAAIARIDLARQHYLDAEPLLIIAERTLSAAKHPDRSALAAIEAGLARVALARGDTNAAADWARRAMERDATGSTAPERALGAVLARQGKFAEGARILRRALARDRRIHGNDSTETARSLSQLGNLYLRQKRAKAALPFLEEAAAIDRDRLGPDHPFIADDLHDVGIACEALQRDNLARLLLRQALAILQRGAGRATPRAAYVELELRRVYERAGEHAAAQAAFKVARPILDKTDAERRRRERKA